MPSRRSCPHGPGGSVEFGDRFARIPLRLRPGQPIPFRPEDVILQTGDIVFIEDRATEVFYTGGLIPAGQFPLPRDYDLDVVEAISLVHGPLVNGGVNANNLSGSLIPTRIGTPSPSLVTVIRRTPCGGTVRIRVDLNLAMRDRRESLLVKPGDVLILQETLGEAVARYTSQVVNFSAFFQLFRGNNANGSASVVLP